MHNITTIGIDIAKNIFQIHALDANGKPMLTKRVKRPNLLSTLAHQRYDFTRKQKIANEVHTTGQ